MRAKRRFNIGLWVLLCVPCLLASCDHDVHDGEGDGGLSVSLAWADEADEGTEVKDVKTWIVNATDGTQVAQSQYGSAQEMAKERYDLPKGNYRILITTNLVDPFTISEQTRAVDNINSLAIGLSDPSASPEHAYYGVTDIVIDKEDVHYITRSDMRRILAELTIVIEGVPENTVISGKVLNVAMVRCGYRSYGSGILTEDTSFNNYAAEALKNNIKIGAYFFSQAINVEEAKEEAEYVLNMIKPYQISGPVAIDVEEIFDDTYRQMHLSASQLTDVIITFCDRIKEAGYTPMIYSNLSSFIGNIELDRLENYEKWLAYYSDEPYFPYEMSMWQYTDSGSIDGITGNVDLNISFKEWN